MEIVKLKAIHGKKRKCIVPSCKYFRYCSGEENLRSMFQCPKNETKAQQWADLIPGIDVLKKSQVVCEIHFESRFIIKTFSGESVKQTRLTNDAYPTIFFDHDLSQYNQTQIFLDDNVPNYQTVTEFLYNNVSNYNEAITFDDNNIRNYDMPIDSLDNSTINHQQTTSMFCDNSRSIHTPNTNVDDNTSNHQILSTTTQASLQDIIKDLSASEKLLMDIKKEEFPDNEMREIKVEKLEGCTESVEMYSEIEIPIYEKLKNNLDYIVSMLPDSWSVSELPMGADEVTVISKECTIRENNALMVMYERNIVLRENGSIVYSVHGKTLDSDQHGIPYMLEDIEPFPIYVIGIILKFNDLIVCQGICLDKFNVNNDCNIYKDDLGLCRHANCSLITDKIQCRTCDKYSQHLLIQNDIVIHDRLV